MNCFIMTHPTEPALGICIRRTLTTPPVIPAEGERLKTNLDTDFLKLIAITAMFIDHIGGAFCPELGIFRWIFYGFYPAHLALIALIQNIL